MRLAAPLLLLTLLGCASQPQPTPPPPTTTTTTVAPAPTPTPEPPIEACFPQGVEWDVSEQQDPEEMQDFVREAEEAVGDRCGKDPAESLRLIAQELESHGFCASFMEPDAVFVEREDGRFEEHHPCYFKDGCCTLSNTFKGIYEVKP